MSKLSQKDNGEGVDQEARRAFRPQCKSDHECRKEGRKESVDEALRPLAVPFQGECSQATGKPWSHCGSSEEMYVSQKWACWRILGVLSHGLPAVCEQWSLHTNTAVDFIAQHWGHESATLPAVQDLRGAFSWLPAVAKSLQSCLTLCNPIDQAPLSLGFSRQEYWSGLPFSSPSRLPHVLNFLTYSSFSEERLYDGKRPYVTRNSFHMPDI